MSECSVLYCVVPIGWVSQYNHMSYIVGSASCTSRAYIAQLPLTAFIQLILFYVHQLTTDVK